MDSSFYAFLFVCPTLVGPSFVKWILAQCPCAVCCPVYAKASACTPKNIAIEIFESVLPVTFKFVNLLALIS